MRRHRREFLRVSSVAAAGAAVACGGALAPAPAAAPQASPYALMLQFSGLVVHGSWPATAQPDILSGWDVLMIQDSHHRPRLRLPLRNVANPVNHTIDRYLPDVGVWDLEDKDVVVKLNGVARGEVTQVTGKRPKLPNLAGVPAPCPDPTLAPCPDPTKDDQFLDITWLANLEDVLRGDDCSHAGDGALKDELKAESAQIATGKNQLLASRVRLSRGSVACARPSMAEYERIMFKFDGMEKYGQFLTDLVRFTSDTSPKITIELIPFGSSTGSTIEVVPGPGEKTILGYVEHLDPSLATRVVNGEITRQTYWAHHFTPALKLLKAAQPLKTEPKPECCNVGCEPPFYCFNERGFFE